MKFLRRLIITLLIFGMVVVPIDVRASEPLGETGAGNIGDPAQSTNDGTQEPDKKGAATKLIIDNQNKYEGMSKTYSEGYVPKVENGSVVIVIPLTSAGDIKDNVLRASLNLGDTQSIPFVYKNYEKNIPLQNSAVNDGTSTVDCYLVSFTLELTKDRINGSYPVILTVKGTDASGNDIEQQFTTYVTITDGKNLEEEPVTEEVPEELPTFAPKVMVQSYKYSKESIQAGDEVTAEITLINTSKTNSVKNMTVTVNAPPENITLLSSSDSIYVESIGSGEIHIVTFKYKINTATAQGQYTLDVTMDYADEDGNAYSTTGKAKLTVEQPLEIQFDPLVIPQEVEVGDTVEASIQAMNLGRSKAYNVRAVIECDGIKPQGTIFIGDIEPGSVATGSIQVSVGSLTEGNSMYGQTKGVVTFYYEDEAGLEQTESMEFNINISSPFSDSYSQPAPDKTIQWWVIMAVIGIALLAFAAVIIIRKIKRRSQESDEDYDSEETDSEEYTESETEVIKEIDEDVSNREDMTE